MKIDFKIIIFLAVYFMSRQCHTSTIIGSPLISTGLKYKLFLESNETSSVKISLDAKNIKTVNDFSTNPVLLEIEPPIDESNLYDLAVAVEKNGGCKEQSVGLVNTADRPIVFIYLSKPIYRTGEKVTFRIFVLNQKMIPLSEHPQMTVAVLDSKDNIIVKVDDAKISNYGEFEEFFEIADDPNLGNWKIEVNMNDRKIEKSFEVQKFFPGDIEVLIDVNSVVAFEDRRVYFTIYTQNPDKNFVIGNAKINCYARFVDSSKNEIEKKPAKSVKIDSSKTVVDINFQDDLGIRFPTADMILKLDIEVTETSSQKLKIASKEVLMKYKEKHTIQVIRKTYFKPGLKLPIKIRVKLPDGKTDNSFHQLSVGIEYKNGNSKISDKNFQTSLKNGEYIYSLEPTADTTKIILNLRFAGAEHQEEIDQFPSFGANEYMQVNAVGKSTVGETLKISAKTSGEMEVLHVLVFGLNGIVYSEEFFETVGKDIHNFSIIVTEEMKPESRGLVFYMKPKSAIMIYDEFSIKPGLSIENSLELTAAKTIKPNEDPQIQVKSEDGAFVFLSAIDQNSELINRNNEISRNEIYNELTYYIDMKYPNSTRYHFEKLNAFVLEPFVNGYSCGSSKTKKSSDKTPDTKVIDSQYFPDVLFDKIVGPSYSRVFPNSLKSWRLFGVSVHPEKGFTVAKEQPIITVKSDFAVHIDAPSFFKVKELLKIKITASSFLDTKIDGEVAVEITGGSFMHNAFAELKKIKTERISIESKRNPKTIEYIISSEEITTILIKATLTVGSDKFVAEKSIKVIPFGMKLTSKSFLMEIKKNVVIKSSNNELKAGEEPTIVVYGNLLGPALNGLETMFNMPLLLDEEKMMKFATAIINFKFMKMQNLENDPIAKKARFDMIKGYQEALRILDKTLEDKRPQSIKFAALITGILIDATDVINVDENKITRALEIIVKQQKQDGSFVNDHEADPRREINDNKFPVQLQTASIVQTFIKAKLNLNQDYGDVIQKSLNFLAKEKQKFDDYTNVIVAYTFALHGKTSDAKNFLETRKIILNMGKPKYLSLYSEILSYNILTKILIKEDPKSEVNELISNHRDGYGAFYSPYTTVLALQALNDYTELKSEMLKEFSFEISGDKIKLKPLESKEIELKSKLEKTITVLSDGLGYANVFDYAVMKTFNHFLQTENIVSENKMNLPLKFTYNSTNSNLKSNLIVVEMEMPRGYRFDRVVSANFDYTMKNQYDNTAIAFYVKSINNRKDHAKANYEMTISTSKVYDISKTKSLVHRVYDYYRPNIPAVGYYSPKE